MKKYLVLGLFILLPFFAKAETQVFGFMNGQFFDIKGDLKYACLGDGNCYDYTTSGMTTLSKILGLSVTEPQTITIVTGQPTPPPQPQIVYVPVSTPVPTPSPVPQPVPSPAPIPTTTPAYIEPAITGITLDPSSANSQSIHSGSVNQIIAFFNVLTEHRYGNPNILELTFTVTNPGVFTHISVAGMKAPIVNGIAIVPVGGIGRADFQVLVDFATIGEGGVVNASSQITLTGIKYLSGSGNNYFYPNVSSNTFTLIP